MKGMLSFGCGYIRIKDGFVEEKSEGRGCGSPTMETPYLWGL